MDYINIENYEAWMLDYAEGTLNEVQCNSLFAFLNEHPHLKSLLPQSGITKLNPEKVSFNKKALLRKSEDAEENKSSVGEVNEPRLISVNEEFESKENLYHLDINEHNIEEFIIASIENMLNGAEKNALSKFLYEHPEYEPMQRLYASTVLPSNHEVFQNKDLLCKTLATEKTIDELLIQEIEGTLSESDRILLNESILQNPSYDEQKKNYALTKLAPTNEVFPNKEKLKRRITLFPVTFIRYAAAACVFLALGLYYFNTEKTTPIANKTIQEKNNNTSTESNSLANSNLVNSSHIPSTANEIELKKSEDKVADKHETGVKEPRIRKQKQTPSNLAVELPEDNKEDTLKVELPATAVQLADKLIALDSIETADAVNATNADTQLPYISYSNQTNFENYELLTPRSYLQKIVNDNTSAAMGADNDIAFEAMPAKQKMYGWFAWALRKISGNRLDLKTEFYAENSLARLEVEGTKIKIIK
ncbi:MAG: hypothetical protein IPO27_12255 [Bacteroidetes bacterium]|nr:hypothetical protein [Bacteroidota bacterium]